MTIRKLTALALSCLMGGMALTGCQNKEGSPAAQAADPNKVYNVGICQLVQHDALDAATRGFKDGLTEKLGEGRVTFNEQVGDGSDDSCKNICADLITSGCELIMANATPALQSAMNSTPVIPIVGTSITDYGTAINATDWTGVTGINVTGTCDLAPIDQQESIVKELFPDVKKVGILFNNDEPNSRYQARQFESALSADGIEFAEYSASSTEEVKSMAAAAAAECQAIYVPTDNLMAANTEEIRAVTGPAKIPVVAGEEGICSACGAATVCIDYYDIGKEAGYMAYEILAEGKDPAKMEIRSAAQYTKEYNINICKELGITPPGDYFPIIGSENN